MSPFLIHQSSSIRGVSSSLISAYIRFLRSLLFHSLTTSISKPLTYAGVIAYHNSCWPGELLVPTFV
jgi:hypothetical protein